jgi:hypothetical protein
MSADEMFEKLGYKKYESEIEIKYIFEGTDTIVFEKRVKDIRLYIWNDGATVLDKTLNVSEVQAINKKCEELGWI